MSVGAAPQTLSIPNLSDSYAERITQFLGEPSRRNWLAGCARSSALGLFWGIGDRAVLCPARWTEPVVADLELALGLRMTVHRMPEDLVPAEGELDQLARQLRAFDSGSGFRVVSWSATPRLSGLVTALLDRGVTIVADGRPAPPHWSDEYLNSKTGLRHIVQRVEPSNGLRLPPGIVCTHPEQACEAALSLLRAGHERVVLKADRGAGGFGHFLVHAGVLGWDSRKRDALARVAPALAPLLTTSPIVAEAWIEHSPESYATPSVMLELGDQGVELVGTAATFMELGTAHAGAIVGAGALPAPLNGALVELGHAVAEAAQAIGYRGPLGVDAVVKPDGELFLLEINARRTMVSHCYDLLQGVFGGADAGAVASCEFIRVRGTGLGSYESVRSRLQAMWLQPQSRCGVLISHLQPASEHDEMARISLVALDKNAADAAELLRRALRTLGIGVPLALEESA
jgi:hypothetical protein